VKLLLYNKNIMTRSYFDNSDNWKNFENHSKEFLKKMKSVSDFYNIVISRSEGHKKAIDMGVKADDYEWHANGYLKEYINKYKDNVDQNFYPEGLKLLEEKFNYIYTEFVELIKIAVSLNVNIPPPMYYDYCSSVSSLKAVELAIKEIQKLEEE